MTLRQSPHGLESTERVEVTCPDCRGDGEIRWREFDGSETGFECNEPCGGCDGRGFVYRDQLIRDPREDEQC